MKVIGRHPDEHGCRSLIYAVSQKYVKQNRFTLIDLERALWMRLRDKKIEILTQLETCGPHETMNTKLVLANYLLANLHQTRDTALRAAWRIFRF